MLVQNYHVTGVWRSKIEASAEMVQYILRRSRLLSSPLQRFATSYYIQTQLLIPYDLTILTVKNLNFQKCCHTLNVSSWGGGGGVCLSDTEQDQEKSQSGDVAKSLATVS